MDGTVKASRVAERGRQRAIGNSVVVCVRVCVHAFLRKCVSVSACVRSYVRVNQCVAPPCIDQKRGPNSRLLLNLIPERPFTMFSISLYDDIRRKETSQKRICEFFVPIEHIFKAFACGYPRGTGKGF